MMVLSKKNKEFDNAKISLELTKKQERKKLKVNKFELWLD